MRLAGFVPVFLLLFVFSVVTGMFSSGTALAAPGDQLIHNSTNTTPAGSDPRWKLDGGWGIQGGKYGEFSCETCHVKNASNIKRIRSTITTPDTSKGTLPGDGQTILFDRIIGTPGDPGTLGDDSVVPRAAQKHICEVCHTQTSVHKYNTAGQTEFDGAVSGVGGLTITGGGQVNSLDGMLGIGAGGLGNLTISGPDS